MSLVFLLPSHAGSAQDSDHAILARYTTIVKEVQNNDRKASKRFGYGDDSMPENMVRFEKKDDVINLLSPRVNHIEDDSFMYSPYYKSLIDPTIKTFRIVAMSDNNYLIDITDYLLNSAK